MAADTLSRRGRGAITPALPYFALFGRGIAAGLHSPDKPDGHVLLAVAESRLTFERLLLPKLREVRAALSAGTGLYANMRGRESLRRAWARMTERTVLTSGTKIDPEKLVVGSGCGGLLSHLAFLLCEAGDGVLLPTPTYAALYNDFFVESGARVVDVPLSGPRFEITEAMLDAAVSRAARMGTICKVLFLINPSNPLGIEYSAEQVRLCVDYAREHGLHLVVDEIYANSRHSAGGAFSSAVDVCAADSGSLGDFVHVLWGASKDFGASGLRTGVLYTQNASLLAAFANVNYFTTVSNETQDSLAAVLEDEAFVDLYLTESRSALRASYLALVALLDEARLPYVKATAGMFVWLDLRPLLPPPPFPSDDRFACERALTDDMFRECALLFTPGESQHASEPGYYRVCFAWMPIESVVEAFRRLKAFAERRRGATLA